jgi:hypothetical protein
MSAFWTAAQLAAPQLGAVAEFAAPPIVLENALARDLDTRNRKSRGLKNRKRPSDVVWELSGSSKKPRLQLTGGDTVKKVFIGKKKKMPKFKRRSRKTRRTRSFKRKSKFASRKRRKMRKFTGTQQKNISRAVNQSLKPTDANGPNILGFAPFSYGPTQGVATNQFIGNTIFLRGVRLRLCLRVVAAVAQQIKVRAFSFFCRSNSPLGANGTLLTSATTDLVQPACVLGETNNHVFDTGLNAWSPFVGDDITSAFDTSNCRIKTMKHTTLNTYGQTATLPVKLVDWWFPVNRVWKIEDIGDGSLGNPLFGKNWTFYIYIQMYDGTGAIHNVSELNYDLGMTSYWRNMQ